ncbi:MAG TPA: hypothetical protein VJR25_13335 [Microbacterium sp.]|jgi:uncharacterized protein (DUF983 family)|uniref:hypothetical protein n=1 Tax=Microbacterium sp. TaxID=51671 RepID=UPI002B476608|nr:hypothetical protein [Microbacterium sp.]HKT57748.1 hypothetical protein [Microbacterium sp.]
MSTSDPGAPAPDTATSVVRLTGRIATPARVVIACVPVLLILVTPFLPFAVTPTLWFGVPAVLVWMAFTVILTVVLLNVVDAGIRRQVREHADAENFDGGEHA